MAQDSFRLFSCARCGDQVVICTRCDRGNIYCFNGCAKLARLESLRRAGKRYRKDKSARLLAAARQAAYRERQKEKVTHQGPPEPPAHAMLGDVEAAACTSHPDAPAGRAPGRVADSCGGCGRTLGRSLIRLEFIGRRGRPRAWPFTRPTLRPGGFP